MLASPEELDKVGDTIIDAFIVEIKARGLGAEIAGTAYKTGYNVRDHVTYINRDRERLKDFEKAKDAVAYTTNKKETRDALDECVATIKKSIADHEDKLCHIFFHWMRRSYLEAVMEAFGK